ncbi:hypothetical protein D3C86_2006240 [compost metagenome]
MILTFFTKSSSDNELIKSANFLDEFNKPEKISSLDNSLSGFFSNREDSEMTENQYSSVDQI